MYQKLSIHGISWCIPGEWTVDVNLFILLSPSRSFQNDEFKITVQEKWVLNRDCCKINNIQRQKEMKARFFPYFSCTYWTSCMKTTDFSILERIQLHNSHIIRPENLPSWVFDGILATSLVQCKAPHQQFAVFFHIIKSSNYTKKLFPNQLSMFQCVFAIPLTFWSWKKTEDFQSNCESSQMGWKPSAIDRYTSSTAQGGGGSFKIGKL